MEAPSPGAALLADTEAFIKNYLSLPDGAALAIGAWTAGTYVADRFDVFPFLALTSPTYRCGKTRLLEVLEVLTYRPKLAASISPAALYRVVTALRPTLLIDEAQSLRRPSGPLHDILAAGHRRGAKVTRVIGNMPTDFEVYSPKAIACIGRLSPVLTDRSMEIRMHRRLEEEKVAPFFREEANALAEPLRKKFALWALGSIDEIAVTYLTMSRPDFLADREAENWAPLLATASVADPSATERLKEVAKAMAEVRKKDADETADEGVRLLASIQSAFHESGETFLKTKELLGRLHSMEEAGWRDHGGRGLNAEMLARLLRQFNIRPRLRHRRPDAPYRGYALEDFTEMFARYVQSGKDQGNER